MRLDNKAEHARTKWHPRLTHHFAPVSSSTVSRLIMTFGDYLVARSRSFVLTAAVLMVGVIGMVDLVTGSEIALSLFYLFPIALVTWRLGKSAGFVISCASAAVWLGADWAAGHVYSNPAIPFWNALVRLGFFLIVAFTLAELSTLLQCVQTDYLTGLANVRGFAELAGREFNRCDRMGKGISIAYLDIDDFKRVNDSLGHAAGDAVLRLFGSCLQNNTRKSDIVARVGGDEFTILLVDTTQSLAPVAMRQIEKQILAELKRSNLPVTFTVGLATFDRVPESVEAALETADGLMYAAKRKGKNRLNHRLFSVRAEASSL